MNKKLFTLLSGVAIITSASLQSCADEFDPQVVTAQDQRLQEYYNNFVKEFGEPDPNHTWGWGMTPEMADAILANSKAATRAGADDYSKSGTVNTNRNEWCKANDQSSLLNIFGVPGWPNDDGRYYGMTTSYSNGHYDIYEKGDQPTSINMPNGDVTEYEILWVTNAMHYLPDDKKVKLPLHVSDFYVQGISSDGDYEDDANYKAGTIKSYYGQTNYNMDEIKFKSLGGADTWTHLNNFNASDLADKPRLHAGNNSKRLIMFVLSAGTENFEFHPSNGGEFYDKYILVELSWTEPLNPDWSKVGTGAGQYSLEYVLTNPEVLDPEGKTIERKGYYLGFDYKSEKQEYTYDGDEVYDNYILKISPAYPKLGQRWPKRIMCEDLGNTNDFDFNDAVFDLSFSKNVNTANAYDMIVNIQAAGGTMPIVVAVDPKNWVGTNMEIHSLLGNNEVKTPVNVIHGGAKAPAAQYRIKNCFEYSGSDNDVLLKMMAAYAFKMCIYVKNGGDWESVSGYNLSKGLRAPGDQGYNEGDRGRSNYPQLFNCSNDAKWTYENGHIKYAYKHFIDWVHDEQCNYRLRWDKNQFYMRADEYKEKIDPDYVIDPALPLVLVTHDDAKVNAWEGSWDFGPKTSEIWGSSAEWIDKSKCYGGTGAE